MSDSHQRSIPFSWTTVTTATVSSLTSCYSFLEQTKRFLYMRVLQSVGATLYYMFHAHPFQPQIVPYIFHTLSYASLCISQKIGSDSRAPRALIPPSQVYRSQGHAVTFYFQCSTFSSASRLLFLRPQRINYRIFGRRGQWSWRPLHDTTLLRRTYILKINKVFTRSVITGYNFDYKQCLWRQIQNTDGGIQGN
jgi:hypothetical protein